MPRDLDVDLVRELDIKDELIALFVNKTRRKLRPLSRYNYALDIMSFKRFIRKPLTEVKSSHIDKYIDHLELDCDYEISSIQRKVSALKKFYKFLEREGIIAVDPTAKIEPPRDIDRNKKEPVFLTQDEINTYFKHLLSCFDTDGFTEHDLRYKQIYAMSCVCIFAGLRVSEVVNLNLEDFVDFESGSPYIHVLDAKGGKNRKVDVGQVVVDAFNMWMRARPRTPEKACFLNIFTKKRLSDRTIQRNIKRIAREAGITKEITPHKLRHSYASLMINKKDVNLAVIMELLGHSNIKTTSIYLHADRRHKREAVQDLGFDTEINQNG